MPPDDRDDATLKQMHRLRVRGAPAIRPGMPNFVGEYACKETQLPAIRTLQLSWAEGVHPTRAMLTDAFERLAASAAKQKLKVVGDSMWVLLADPYLVEPPKRSYAAVLPIRGEAVDDGDLKVSRLEGGLHITATTYRGLPDLEYLYTYLFGRFLPSKSHVLVRPAILHKIVGTTAAGGVVETAADRELLVEVLVPSGFEMKKRDPSVTEGAAG
jgi:DNA gyrase inhibitor GyrI